MIYPFVGQFRGQIRRLVKRLFSDPELVENGTYAFYQGRSEEPITFTAPIVCVSHVLEADQYQQGVFAQGTERVYWMRDIDLPAGVNAKDLTLNDTLTVGNDEFAMKKVDPTLEFVIELTIWGSK